MPGWYTRYLGLAEPDIAADEPVHRPPGGEIGKRQLDCARLIASPALASTSPSSRGWCRPRKRKRARAGIADGSVRIIVGTHALAAKGLRFKELGLLVIDEEQRFGTAAKARLRALGGEAHVLTMTATPIPRTLQLAVVGLRSSASSPRRRCGASRSPSSSARRGSGGAPAPCRAGEGPASRWGSLRRARFSAAKLQFGAGAASKRDSVLGADF
jgi:hypothetical protein